MATLPLPDLTRDAAMQRPWPTRAALSRCADWCEDFLARGATDRGPWLTVALASGIGLWFLLPSAAYWFGAVAGLVICALAALAVWRGQEQRSFLLLACTLLPFMCAAGIVLIWVRSEMVGAPAIAHPQVRMLNATIIERDEQPAENRVRLTLAVRDAEEGRAMKVRVNVPFARDKADFSEGAHIRLRARLMPPAPPLVPGAFNFARKAWFDGLAASGTLIGEIELIRSAPSEQGALPALQRRLAAHVRSQVDGSAGSIAAAFASGDRGAISRADEDAMRDAGLTHLLSISGLHVSALIAACYISSLKLLALWSWLTLRVRLPLLAAGIGAAGGVAYTLLTGAEVPTVRSCLAALLILLAMALGREPLSLRMIAIAAAVVMLLWPEALIGPSFQMSFAAVIAIVALHGSAPMRRLLAPAGEIWWRRLARHAASLFITGVVIELVLTPIVLFHFHRAGFYGAFANVLAIPLVTFCAMPLIALALLLDLIGAGAPAWWLVRVSLNLLLELAHFTAAQPGAVNLFPQIDMGTIVLFAAGGFWLALWRGRVRLAGLAPICAATLLLIATPAPSMLVTSDGKNVGIAGRDGRLLTLRGEQSSYAVDHLQELSATGGEVVHLQNWPEASCSRDFCLLKLEEAGREWRLLMARSNSSVEERQLAASCAGADIVVASRRLPRSCQPRWLKADRRYLDQHGGLALYLAEERIDSVGSRSGEYGWWRRPEWGS